MSITKPYVLEGLCCENCAAAIEREVNALAEVESATVDYPNALITVVFATDAGGATEAAAAMLASVSAIASEIDEDIVTKEA